MKSEASRAGGMAVSAVPFLGPCAFGWSAADPVLQVLRSRSRAENTGDFAHVMSLASWVVLLEGAERGCRQGCFL